MIVSDLCRRTKAFAVSVCPLLEPLAAFGALVGQLLQDGKEKPRMTRFCVPWDEPLDAEVQLFDEKLEGDGYGRMAHLVQTRTPVLNQMMRTPCIRAFYGRVLTKGWWGSNPIFLMLPECAKHYFPTEPLSIRNYAAMWVPVSVENTDRFAKDSGYGSSRLNIFVASELTPGLGSFLRFVQVMGGDKFVASSAPESIPPIRKKIPVFRDKGAYNIDSNTFYEVINES